MTIIKGLIHGKQYGENGEALFVGEEIEEPIVMYFNDTFCSTQVSIRYYISDTQKNESDLRENHLLAISGALHVDYSDCYSDITGYLWTDEDMNVGGHDLYRILYDNMGKYLYMEVDVL